MLGLENLALVRKRFTSSIWNARLVQASGSRSSPHGIRCGPRAEAKDAYTRGHSILVSHTAWPPPRSWARGPGWDASGCAASCNDIGKMYRAACFTSGHLTAESSASLRSPGPGERMCTAGSDSPDCCDRAITPRARMGRSFRWLTGREIPIEASIVALRCV